MAKFTREEIEEEIKISHKLQRADLRGANLTEAMYNNDTKFPEDTIPEKAGMVSAQLPLALGV
jgi:uncharacterized protein YjbI with pentapeptide repeats